MIERACDSKGPEERPVAMSGRVSQRDIARRMGVSHVTVSMALRGSTRISKELGEKIREYAEAVGYRPDPMLTALSSYRLNKTEGGIRSVLAWVNAWEDAEGLRSYREFDLYWKGAQAAARKFGYRLEEFRVGPDLGMAQLHQILTARGIRGILLPPQKSVPPQWAEFPWEHYAVVRYGRSLAQPATHLVTSDQTTNGLLAFERIRAKGYRRIGFVSDEERTRDDGHLFAGHMFVGGYLMGQRALPAKERIPVLSLNGVARVARGRVLAEWIRRHRVEAVFTERSELPELLAEQGIRVPEDVALAVTSVLDGNADAGIDQHPEEIGRVGVLMLHSLISDGAFGVPKIFRQILIEGGWVDGASMPEQREEAASVESLLAS